MPRMGMGMPIAAPTGRAPALSIVDNGVFEQIVSGEITPEFTTTRTNLTIYSQDVSQSTWTKSNVAVDGTAVEAPNNTTTAQAITGSANTSSRKTSQTTALTAGLTYTYSAYVKAVAFSHVRLSINDGTVEHTQDFNITNASNGSAGAASNVLRSQIEKLDNNWFRVMLTIQCQNSNSDATYGVLSMAANNTPNVQVAVGGTVLMHVWGQQFEQDIQANAYIATSNTTKTAATALVDVNSVWDFDGTDLVVEADPSDEGFWEAPDNIVLNGDYEELGSEIINNGIFAGATISGDGSSFVSITQSGVFTNGKQYKVTVDVTINSGLGLKFQDGANNENIGFATTSGSYTFYFTAGSNASFTIGRRTGGTPFDSLINSVSIKQVDPNDRWQLQYTGTGDWSITDKLNFENVNGGSAQLNVFEVGATYEITVDYVFTSGTRLILPYDGSNFPTGGVITTTGSVNGYTYYYTPSNTSLLIYSDGNGNGSIDNVTVREYAIQPQDV